jgi:O-antigen ligase
MKLLSTIPRYAIYSLLIFTPLARGAVHGWAIGIIHIVTLIALTAVLLNKCWNGKWRWIRTPLDQPILLSLILCLISSAFSVHFYSSLWALVLFVNYIVIFYLTIHSFTGRSQLQRICFVIIGVAVFLSIFGLFKRFGANPFPWWEYSDLRYSPDLLSATYGNHNHLAGYLEMAIPLILGLFLAGYSGSKRLLMICLTFCMFTALILSLSRGGWLGLLIGLVFMGIALITNPYFKKKSIIIAVTAGFLVVAFVVLVSTPVVERLQTFEQKHKIPNLNARVRVWGGVVKMIQDHPLLGTGPGTFATVFTQYQPPGFMSRYFRAHNDYLHFISEVGIFLIPVIIWMIIVLYRKGFRKFQNPSRLVRGTTLGAMSGITALLVHSISDFNLHIPANALLFTVLASMVAAPLPKHNRTDQ